MKMNLLLRDNELELYQPDVPINPEVFSVAHLWWQNKDQLMFTINDDYELGSKFIDGHKVYFLRRKKNE